MQRRYTLAEAENQNLQTTVNSLSLSLCQKTAELEVAKVCCLLLIILTHVG